MAGKSELLYQGHASFRLCSPGGAVIYIDPYAGTGYGLAADAVFCTHEHRDHSRVELVQLKPGGWVYRQAQMYDNGVYAIAQVADVAIRAVPAYNDKHPREKTVGYLVEMAGKKLYFAGDTSWIPEMEALAEETLDYAFFPTDGIFNMDAAEASMCAERIAAANSVPIHTCKNTDGIFNEENALRFQAKGRLILRPGERLTW